MLPRPANDDFILHSEMRPKGRPRRKGIAVYRDCRGVDISCLLSPFRLLSPHLLPLRLLHPCERSEQSAGIERKAERGFEPCIAGAR
jgi:hypothetical protein